MGEVTATGWAGVVRWCRSAVEPFSRGGHVEGLVGTVVVVVGDPFVERLLGGLDAGETWLVRNSARRLRWNRSILPVVVG